MTSVLMIMTAADHWTLNDGTKHPTGFWAEEFVVPYEKFVGAGWDVTVATPGGVPPTVDPASLGIAAGLPGTAKKMKAALDELAPVLGLPRVLADVVADVKSGAASFDLVFYPGGHGPMEDLVADSDSGELLRSRMEAGQPLALLCHAPAVIRAAGGDDGASPFAGRRMTGFSNAEERLNRLADKAPWLLEDELVRLGVEYDKALVPLASNVVVDGNLYTGQNPKSSEKLADRLIEDLSR